MLGKFHGRRSLAVYKSIEFQRIRHDGSEASKQSNANPNDDNKIYIYIWNRIKSCEGTCKELVRGTVESG